MNELHAARAKPAPEQWAGSGYESAGSPDTVCAQIIAKHAATAATPGQAAYEAFATVALGAMIKPEPFSGRPASERGAWNAAAQAAIAAQQPQPAPGMAAAEAKLRETAADNIALRELLATVRRVCADPAKIVGRTSGTQIVNGDYLARHLADIIKRAGVGE